MFNFIQFQYVMRMFVLIVFHLIFLQPCCCQENVIYFSDVIKKNIKKYNAECDVEFEKGNIEKGTYLFDNFVKNNLVGTRFDDYSFKNMYGKRVKLSRIQKPIFIITYASWFVINKGEIAALNKLAQKHKDEVQVIAVFWDIKNDVRKIATQFSRSVKVCYVNENYRNDATIVAILKHTLGFPTSYYLTADLDVVDIKRGGVQVPRKTSFKKALDQNYTVFNDRLLNFLSTKDCLKERLIATSTP